MFGVRPATLARWARAGQIAVQPTPGGHRRYLRSAVRALLSEKQRSPAAVQREMDAIRLYEQGWSIRRVAREFDTGYGVMRRVILKHTTLRSRAGTQG